MASDLKLLLAGESWTTTATHIKGWDQYQSATFHRGADHFVAAMRKAGTALTCRATAMHSKRSRQPWAMN
jgi:uncharacterized membrane protein